MNDEIILKRDCEAVLIPAGTKITLQAGEPVVITQALGGSFTVIIHGNMARIDARDADALGQAPPAAAPARESGRPGGRDGYRGTSHGKTAHLLRPGNSRQHRRSGSGL